MYYSSVNCNTFNIWCEKWQSNSKSREEIAREIKEIFSYVKSSNRDENVKPMLVEDSEINPKPDTEV